MAKTFSFEEALAPATAGPVTFSFEDALPKSTNPFLGSAGASTERLKGEMALLAAKLGFKDAAEAEKYYKEQEAKGASQYIPTTKGWTEAPGTKIAELAGSSLPYMAAPLAAAGAAALAPEVAIAGIGSAALAGGAASTAQFTGSNLARQVQEGKSLEEASLGKAAAAAVPQAALDIVGFKMLPGVRTIFGKAGVDLTEEAAAEVAKRSVAKIAQDFTLRTGKVMTAEGLTETGQQVLERMQAGLSITDPQARQEYLDSFVGGSVLGGVISGPGQLVESAMKKPSAEAPPEAPAEATPIVPTTAAPAIITDENIEPPIVETPAAPMPAPVVAEEAAPAQAPVTPPAEAPVEQTTTQGVTAVTPQAETQVVQIPVTTNKEEQQAAINAMKELPAGGMIEMNGARYRKNEVGGWDVVTPSTSAVEAPAVEEVKTEVPALEAVAPAEPTQAEINKQRQAAKKAEAKRKAKQSNTLLAELTRLGGVSVADKLDVTGEKGAMLTGGYSRVFKKDAKAGLMNHIESGNLDEYLPYDMRLATDPMSFDATPAYEYLSDRIRNGEKVLPFEEEERLQAEAYQNRPPKIEPTQEEINAELAAEAEKEIPLELEGQTPEQIKAEEEARRVAMEKDAEEAAKVRADEAAKEFTLTGSNRDADIAAARGAQDLFSNISMPVTKGSTPIQETRKASREETIQEYAGVRRRIRTKTKQVAKYGSDIPLQRQLNKLLEQEQILKDDINATKEVRDSADDFLARATKEMADENISRDVFDVVQHIHQRFPGVLDGVRLSVKTFKGDRGGEAGRYNPPARIVTLWKSTSGTEKAETIRHELMHSLEQMMPPAAKKAVVEEWARRLEDAMKTNIDPASKAYFDAVVAFNDNPTKETFDAAVKVMPSYDFYQYLNPSEYWAVNAEKMFASKLGTPWNRFVLAVKRMFQGLKSVFGFNNSYASHKAFNDLIENTPERTDQMLMNYFKDSDLKLDFIKNIEDYNEKRAKFDRANAPVHPSSSVKDTFMGGYGAAKKLMSDMAENPVLPTTNMIGKLDRAVTNARNKNIWYGTGLEQADFEKYNGQLRTSEGHAVASVALTNAVHSGHIATQVMTQGALAFNAATQMFKAVKNKFSMANVVRAKAELIKKFGEQTANNMIYDFFEAKRSRSIINEYLDREAAYEEAIESGENAEDAKRDLLAIEKAMNAVNMTDEEIDAFIDLDKDHPELRTMMENWTAVNHNMLDMAAFSGVMSKKRAEHLKTIKDYVPWYRIMDDQADPHQQPGANVRGLTNVSKEKKIKGSTRQIDDIVDNMIHNVMMMTRNSMRNYAANRIVMEYGTRNEKNKLKVFATEGVDSAGVRFNILANGRRVVVQIPDPLVAEAVMGMENIDIPMINALSIMSNFFRRGITTFPAFQIGQLFMDAPMAAWASGVKNPAAVWAGTFSSFVRNIKSDDPIVSNLRAYGIGGYQSSARTPEKELKLEIGLLNGSWWDKTLKALDRFGDASDYSQRRSIYNQVLKETGDELQAVMAANNVIDFLKRGSGKGAQAVTKSVAFMNAYAQSIDVLAKTLAGGGLKGMKRQAAIAQMLKTGMLLTAATLTYCMLVGDDDDYLALDDQTKMRNIIIPGTKLRLPMHTSASFFFKAMPELLYNKIINEGTKNEMDAARVRKALSQAAKDSLLGPNITPTGVRPALEVALNKDFFTGSTVTPRGMEKLEAFRQYNASTSELGKVLSSLSGGTLNPIEMDHLVRGMLGTAGAATMWGVNMFSGDKPTAQAKENPLYGSFILPEIPRGKEDLYYDLKEHTDRAYFTFMDLNKKGHKEDAKKYYQENVDLIRGYGYTSGVETSLKEINAEIRRTADLPADQMSPDMKRQRMNDLAKTKNRMLDDVIAFRKRAGL